MMTAPVHPFLDTKDHKYSDWVGTGSAHQDYREAVGDGPAPDEVLVSRNMLLLVWPDRVVCTGYDGNEYQHLFEFARLATGDTNVR
jgi:hypothetical protein